MHPEWLSNAYLVWDEGTREAFFVDSGGPLEPLLAVVERDGLRRRCAADDPHARGPRRG